MFEKKPKGKLTMPGEKDEFSRKTYKKKEMVIYDDKRLWEYSLWLLSRKDYTVKEMITKLKTHQTDMEKIELVISKLLDKKYLNDERRATNIVNSYKNRESPSKLKQRLFNKGVDKETIQQVIEESISEEEPQNTANALLLKKFKIYNKELEQKYYSHLASRGFGWDIISKAVDSFKDECSSDDQE